MKNNEDLDELNTMALQSLRNERCVCGRHKGPEKSFCKLCTNSLTPELRAGLFATFKDGYAVNFGAAVQYLNDHTSRFAKVRA